MNSTALKPRVCLRILTLTLVVLVLAVGGADAPLRAQSGPDVFGGLGELIGSFFARDAYVGSTRIDLLRLRDRRSRLHFHGFSIDPPSGGEWYLAFSSESNANVIQTVWFVKEPHLVGTWAKPKRITARPSSLIAKLEFYGASTGGDFVARVKRAKSAEWATQPVRILTLEAHPTRIGDIECAEYTGQIVDSGVPPGFDVQPFVVTLAGRACPHPDAPWLTVDVSGMRRSQEAVPPSPPDAGGEAFVRSLVLDAFNGPPVTDILLLDRAERPLGGNQFWVEGTALTDDALWVSHRAEGPHPDAPRRLSRIAVSSNQLMAQVPVHGTVAGMADNTVWMVGKDSAWRIDAATASPTGEVPLTCSPGVFIAQRLLQAGAYGVWLGCMSASQDPRHTEAGEGFLQRVDPITGAPIAAVAMPRRPGRLQGDQHLAWAQEEPFRIDERRCRLYAIDPASNRLSRTVVLGSFQCRHVAIAGDEAWMVRGTYGRAEIAKVDLAAGRVVATIPVPTGRLVLGLALGRDLVWVSTSALEDGHASGARLGSTGGVLRIDRTTARLEGTMLPTGTVDRIIGISGGAVWLYDSEGAILRIRERSR